MCAAPQIEMYPEKKKKKVIFQHPGIVTHILSGIMTSIFSVCHQETHRCTQGEMTSLQPS